MLRRNLVYTGIMRGKRLVGQRKALTIAVRDSRVARRWSNLVNGYVTRLRSKREPRLNCCTLVRRITVDE
jgi:ATP-dependent exoDNAse (exonuclease V) alpha subunit